VWSEQGPEVGGDQCTVRVGVRSDLGITCHHCPTKRTGATPLPPPPHPCPYAHVWTYLVAQRRCNATEDGLGDAGADQHRPEDVIGDDVEGGGDCGDRSECSYPRVPGTGANARVSWWSPPATAPGPMHRRRACSKRMRLLGGGAVADQSGRAGGQGAVVGRRAHGARRLTAMEPTK